MRRRLMSLEDVNFSETFPFELWLFGQATSERRRQWKSQMIILCKWWTTEKTLCLFQCFSFVVTIVACLSFLSILMKIKCKQFSFLTEKIAFLSLIFKLGFSAFFFPVQINTQIVVTFPFLSFFSSFSVACLSPWNDDNFGWRNEMKQRKIENGEGKYFLIYFWPQAKECQTVKFKEIRLGRLSLFLFTTLPRCPLERSFSDFPWTVFATFSRF